MEKLYAKMQEYLKMDTEIPYTEFSNYYEQIMDYLKTDYEGISNDNLLKGKYILMIVGSNAEGRARRKGPEMKKYKKITEKCSFWEKAINYRLTKEEGMTQQQIDEALEKLGQENE